MIRDILKYSFCLFVETVLSFGCTSKKASPSASPINETENMYDTTLQTNFRTSDGYDTASTIKQEAPKHSNLSSLELSVNPYYDEGYEQGQEDGYNDGIENLRGDSYDDSCHYRGKRRKEYELGYEEGYDTGFDDGFADSGLNSEDEE